MPEVIINASGPQYGLVVNPDGSINVSGVNVSVGSLSVTAGSESFNYGVSGGAWASNAVTNEGWSYVRSFNPAVDIGSTGLIVANTETLVIEHVITAGSTYYFIGYDATGTADATFILYHNENIQTQLKINPAERNIQKTYVYPIAYTTGSVVLTAKHQDSNSQNFIGTLYGEELGL